MLCIIFQAGCASLKKGGTEFPGKSEISMVPHSDHWHGGSKETWNLYGNHFSGGFVFRVKTTRENVLNMIFSIGKIGSANPKHDCESWQDQKMGLHKL